MYAYEGLRRLHLELTDKCNAACPQCPRTDHGGAVNPNLPLTELTLEDIRRIVPESLVRQLDIIYCCGNYGDGIAARDTLEIYRYFRRASERAYLGIHTNGGARAADWWRRLALLLPPKKGYARFGIDGLKDTNHLYRRNTQWAVIMRNAAAFIEAGGNAEWDYLVFRHNEHQVEEARALSKAMGFTSFHAKKTARFVDYKTLELIDRTPVKNEDGSVAYHIERPLSPEWTNADLQNLRNIDERHGGMQKYLDDTEISCRAVAEKSIYLSADGHVLPCCWLATHIHARHGKTGHPLLKMIDELGGLRTLDARRRSIQEIVEGDFFQGRVPESWKKKSVAEGRLFSCAWICGKEFQPNVKQFRQKPPRERAVEGEGEMPAPSR